MFTYEGNKIYPLLTKNKKPYDRFVDLLYFKDGDNSHYCWIKNLSRLFNKQINSDGHKKIFCRGCLNYATDNEECLNNHKLICNTTEVCLPKLPCIKSKCSKCEKYKTNEINIHVEKCGGTVI